MQSNGGYIATKNTLPPCQSRTGHNSAQRLSTRPAAFCACHVFLACSPRTALSLMRRPTHALYTSPRHQPSTSLNPVDHVAAATRMHVAAMAATRMKVATPSVPVVSQHVLCKRKQHGTQPLYSAIAAGKLCRTLLSKLSLCNHAAVTLLNLPNHTTRHACRAAPRSMDIKHQAPGQRSPANATCLHGTLLGQRQPLLCPTRTLARHGLMSPSSTLLLYTPARQRTHCPVCSAAHLTDSPTTPQTGDVPPATQRTARTACLRAHLIPGDTALDSLPSPHAQQRTYAPSSTEA
jgi:hypothetical protein